MNKVCIWTQTYGSGRDELYKYHALDLFDIEFRNNFHNLFTFHNCTDDYYNTIVNGDYFKKIKNKTILRYNQVNYTECVKSSIELIKSQGYDYIIYQEDDSFMEFSNNFNSENHDLLLKIIDFITNENFNMINLEWKGDVHFNNVSYLLHDDLKVYKTTSEDYKKIGYWEFDGGAYVAKIDYVLENLYDSQYYSIGDSWQGELYLKNKWSSSCYDRYTFPIGIYGRFNLLGKNSDYGFFKKKLNTIFYEN